MEKIHLLITRCGPVLRVRILSGGVIRWRAYRVADYPKPEAVVRRCAEGLARRREDEATTTTTPTAIKRLVSMVGLGFFGCRRNRRWGKPIVNVRQQS